MLRKDKYKDMEKWKETSKKQKRKYYAKTSNRKNSKKKWTQYEVELIMEHKQSDSELSETLGRSVRSIQIKRCRINKSAKI